MNSFERFLYNNKILKFSEPKLERWDRKELVGNLIYSAEEGTYNIRLKCIELLSTRTSDPLVVELLSTMINDEVEIVAEAAIKLLEPNANSELVKLFSKIRKEHKSKKRRMRGRSKFSGSDYGNSEKTRPSERLMSRLRDQQRASESSYGF